MCDVRILMHEVPTYVLLEDWPTRFQCMGCQNIDMQDVNMCDVDILFPKMSTCEMLT